MSYELTKRCSETIWGGFHTHQCSRRGVIEEGGKLWCRQHAPSRVQARRAEALHRYEEKYRRSNRRRDTEAELLRTVLSVEPDQLPESVRWARQDYQRARA